MKTISRKILPPTQPATKSHQNIFQKLIFTIFFHKFKFLENVLRSSNTFCLATVDMIFVLSKTFGPMPQFYNFFTNLSLTAEDNELQEIILILLRHYEVGQNFLN